MSYYIQHISGGLLGTDGLLTSIHEELKILESESDEKTRKAYRLNNERAATFVLNEYLPLAQNLDGPDFWIIDENQLRIAIMMNI